MVNRNLWTESLTENYSPSWPCPVCSKSNYTLISNSLIFRETIKSKRLQNDPDWDPDFVKYIFSAWLKCAACGQEAVISGNSSWDQDGNDIVTIYTPLFCYPMPDIMVMSATWPKPIVQELRASFLHFWADRPAAANRLRVAIERLMDHFKIKKTYRAGKDRQYNLHQRIGFFSKRHEKMAALLLSIKWLGNTASHNSDISVDDLLDAYEIVEHVLGEWIDKRSTKLETKAKNLTKKHSRTRVKA